MVSSSSPPSSLLSGVRILSFGTVVAGNVCPLLLAELGADVVKIEWRDRPEALRAFDSPFQREIFEPSGVRTTALFAGLTRSMRSMSIDMKVPEGRTIFRALVGRADVVIENLGPGKMEAWGCSFEELRAHNPALVMLSISGYGRSGPLSGFRAYASNINNYLGLTSAWALDGTYFDFVAGIQGASAIVAALASVEKGAPGVLIDMAQTEAGATIMAPLYLDFLANGREWNAAPNEVPGALLSGVFRCEGADAWVAIELEDARDWETMCEYLGRDDLRLGKSVQSDSVKGDDVPPALVEALRDAIGAWVRPLTPFQVTLKLQRAGLAVAPVQNSEDLWRDAQHRSRNCFVDVWHPDIGSVEYPEAPDRLSKTPGRVARRGSRMGEHTRQVLVEWLHLGDTDIRDLEKGGAIWQSRPVGDIEEGTGSGRDQ
jgi:crotonobetainyl-CoA:carnitine CoA-transferase CaiB-like acyl-CoA transferase